MINGGDLKHGLVNIVVFRASEAPDIILDTFVSLTSKLCPRGNGTHQTMQLVVDSQFGQMITWTCRDFHTSFIDLPEILSCHKERIV